MRALLITIVVLLAAGLSYFPWVERLDQKLLDAQYRILRAYALRPVEHDVVSNELTAVPTCSTGRMSPFASAMTGSVVVSVGVTAGMCSSSTLLVRLTLAYAKIFRRAEAAQSRTTSGLGSPAASHMR